MKQQSTTIETWLPVFTGFYNTIWDQSDSYLECELESEAEWRANCPQCEDIPWDFIKENLWDCIDYQSYYLEVAQDVTAGMPAFLNDIVPNLISDCRFQALRSPREYNFANDAVDVEFTIDLHKLQSFLAANDSDLTAYLARKYTSRSGFISSYPNDLEGWKNDTKGFSDLDGHYLGSLLQFIAELEHGDDYDADYALYDCINLECYPDIDLERLLKLWEDQK